MNKTKIEWCDATWNPVWGCLNECNYCFARKISNRFYKEIIEQEMTYRLRNKLLMTYNGNLDDDYNYTENKLTNNLSEFKPVLLTKNLNKSFSKKPLRIFVNSMSDISFWLNDWIKQVRDKIENYPQHTFLFLTKNPKCYEKFIFPKNCWLGTTVNRNEDKWRIDTLRNLDNNNNVFVSFEPLFEEINYSLRGLDWIIIGAQTNPTYVPSSEWVEMIIENAKNFDIPIFVKDNVLKHYPSYVEELRLQEFPQ